MCSEATLWSELFNNFAELREELQATAFCDNGAISACTRCSVLLGGEVPSWFLSQRATEGSLCFWLDSVDLDPDDCVIPADESIEDWNIEPDPRVNHVRVGHQDFGAAGTISWNQNLQAVLANNLRLKLDSLLAERDLVPVFSLLQLRGTHQVIFEDNSVFSACKLARVAE